MVKLFKAIIVILVIVLCMFSFWGCNAKSEQSVILYPELVQYNLVRSAGGSYEFGFNINAISSKKKADIEFVSAEGINTEHISVSFSDDTFDDMRKPINGKYMLFIGVHCLAVSEYTKIDSMKLKLNGEVRNIIFPTPIENTFKKDDEDDTKDSPCLSVLHMPTYVFTNSFEGENETDYTFSVSADGAVTITKIAFNNFIDFVNETVWVNDIELGSIKDVLPLKLKENDELKICGKLTTNFSDGLYMGNIYTNLNFHYDTNSSNEQVEQYPMSAIFIGNRETAEQFVNAMPL